MSSNEFKNRTDLEQEALDKIQAAEPEVVAEKKKRKRKGSAKKDKANKGRGRVLAQIMNGEFLSRENFIRNLPFTFYVGLLMVLIIGWGYYAETVAKNEMVLTSELDELESEYSTLNSKLNERKGREYVEEKLAGTGVEESIKSPKKIRVRKYVFDSGR